MYTNFYIIIIPRTHGVISALCKDGRYKTKRYATDCYITSGYTIKRYIKVGDGCWCAERLAISFFCDVRDSCGNVAILGVARVECLDLAWMKHVCSFMWAAHIRKKPVIISTLDVMILVRKPVSNQSEATMCHQTLRLSSTSTISAPFFRLSSRK
jgi:hypothetical protein